MPIPAAVVTTIIVGKGETTNRRTCGKRGC